MANRTDGNKCHVHHFVTFPFVLLFGSSLIFSSALQAECTAQIGNRISRVAEDGSFLIDNIPSAQNIFARAIVICHDEDGLSGGTSNFKRILAGQNVDLEEIALGIIPPSVKSLALSTGSETLSAAGETAQIAVLAKLSDDTAIDLSTGASGTTYVSSNPVIGTVSNNGLVTAGTQSGTLIISVVNQGVFASKRIHVALSTDGDNDGLPNDYEDANTCLDPNIDDAALDSDNDTLTNLTEFEEGTNPCLSDTDNDGRRDDEELTLGSNPVLPDSDGDGLNDGAETDPASDGDGDGLTNILDPDSDNDGLKDGFEFRIVGNSTGANPLTDSDGDNLTNIDEQQAGTNPLARDTDGDELSDSEEVVTHTTDPLKIDSDNDGYGDGLEVALDSDPLNTGSQPTIPSVGEAVSPTISILNKANPDPGNLPGEAVSPVFSIENTAP